MCYLIEPKESFVFDSMTVTIEKKYANIDRLKVWLTSDYDFWEQLKMTIGIFHLINPMLHLGKSILLELPSKKP